MDSNIFLDDKIKRVAILLIDHTPELEDHFWPWLTDVNGELDKKNANKFFLMMILDYQMKSNVVLQKVKRFIKEIEDPEDLWGYILSFSYDEWMANKGVFNLHKLSQAHSRVWKIGNRLMMYYGGDARNIWTNKTAGEIENNLKVKLRVGEQLSNMCMGALIDAKQINANVNVKADIHVRHVLGSIFVGRDLNENEVKVLTNKMSPENPWLLNRSLYDLGLSFCQANYCSYIDCYLKDECFAFEEEIKPTLKQ